MGLELAALPEESRAAAGQLLDHHSRILLLGAGSIDRGPLLKALAGVAVTRALPLACVDADVGLPHCGPPGAVTRARASRSGWTATAVEPLCTLDAARFRLPLTQAVRRLSKEPRPLVLSAPGLTAGVAGAELLLALVDAAEIEAIVVLQDGAGVALGNELTACELALYRHRAGPDPRCAKGARRARARTRAWERYLAAGKKVALDITELHRLGTPPPAGPDESWIGRQLALGRNDAWHAFGEVTAVDGNTIELRAVGDPALADRLLLRDAARGANHELRTAAPIARRVLAPKQASRTLSEVRCGPVTVKLINGVTGDPTALVRLRHRRSTLLFDVGECGVLSRQLLHTVSDLFLSHAHFDHVAGFPTLLRSRLSAPLPPLRVFGPPGTSEHVAGFLAGVRWDRIGSDGPAFEVTEIDTSRATTTALKAGQTPVSGASRQIDGTLLETPDYRVRVLELDHRIPVLSYRLELSAQHNVDTAVLADRGLQAGPWLGVLKAHVSQGQRAAPVELPDGTRAPSGELADALLRRTVGPSVVYATDFDDHAANRRKLEAFARGAQLLICEATFRNDDAELARTTQHLTTRACGEIASTAGVERLLPFHISKRYEGSLDAVYGEIADACGEVELIRYQ